LLQRHHRSALSFHYFHSYEPSYSSIHLFIFFIISSYGFIHLPSFHCLRHHVASHSSIQMRNERLSFQCRLVLRWLKPVIETVFRAIVSVCSSI
jgi:hypothetical protein